VSCLRAQLLIAIVSLLVLAGYGQRVFGECCTRSHDGHAEHGEKAPGKSDDCQCVCHAPASALAAEPVRAIAAPVSIGDVLPHADEFPPEVMPVGIDHPPQLA
jgi:hypothetical protein